MRLIWGQKLYSVDLTDVCLDQSASALYSCVLVKFGLREYVSLTSHSVSVCVSCCSPAHDGRGWLLSCRLALCACVRVRVPVPVCVCAEACCMHLMFRYVLTSWLLGICVLQDSD